MAMHLQEMDTTIKVIVVGNGRVGKTSMTTRYATGDITVIYKKTIGVDFMEKRLEIDEESVHLMLWDTAGQEEFDMLTSKYYQGAGFCVLVFSTVDRQSFEAIPKWRKKVEAECGRIPMCLVQNKCDLVQRATVSPSEVVDLARRMKLRLYRCSVTKDQNVSAVFEYLVREYLKWNPHDHSGAISSIGALAKNRLGRTRNSPSDSRNRNGGGGNGGGGSRAQSGRGGGQWDSKDGDQRRQLDEEEEEGSKAGSTGHQTEGRGEGVSSAYYDPPSDDDRGYGTREEEERTGSRSAIAASSDDNDARAEGYGASSSDNGHAGERRDSRERQRDDDGSSRDGDAHGNHDDNDTSRSNARGNGDDTSSAAHEARPAAATAASPASSSSRAQDESLPEASSFKKGSTEEYSEPKGGCCIVM